MSLRTRLILAFLFVALLEGLLFQLALDLGFIARSSKGLVPIDPAAEEAFIGHSQSLFFTLATVFISAVVLFLSSLLSRPLRQLQTLLENLERFEFAFSPDEVGDGEVKALSRSIQNVLARLKKSRGELAFFDRAIEATPEALLLLDEDGQLLSANLSARESMGIDGNQPAWRFENQLSEKKDARLWTQFIRSGSPSLQMNVQILQNSSAPGASFSAICSAARFQNPLDSSAAIILSIQNITEILSVRQQRDSYKQALNKSEHLASLGTIVATVAHKLRQPLTALQLFLQQAERKLDDEKAMQRKLSLSLAEVEKARSITEELLIFSRAPASPEAVSVAGTIEQVSAVLEEQARLKQMQIVCEPIDENLQVHAPAGELDTMCFFLMQNAIDAAEDASAALLEISVQVNPESTHLVFSDNCGGIPSEELDRIFDLYFTTKRAGKGSGLGLPIIKKTMSQLGGTVRVESEPDRGSTFELIFPNRQQPENSG